MKTPRLCLLGFVAFFSMTANATAQKTESLSSSLNEFALNLWKKLPKNENSNEFYSPLSVYEAFALTHPAAHEKVKAEYRKVFGATQNSEIFAQNLSHTLNSLTTGAHDSGITLERSNNLWFEKTYPIDAGINEFLAKHYQSSAHPMDFQRNPERSREIINAQIARETHNRIENLLPSGSLQSTTTIVLTNAIYFLADWENEFKKNATRPEPFQLADGKVVEAETMVAAKHFAHASFPEFDALALPYRGNRFEMLWIVPKKNKNLANIEKKITIKALQDVSKSLKSDNKLLVFLPKFVVSGATISLKEPLRKIGLKLIFQQNQFANFPGFSKEEKASSNLVISDVLHKAFVQVDEKGTEAAAATAIMIERLSMAQPPDEFRINKPSLFIIWDKETGIIAFMGRLLNPNIKN